MKLKQVKITLCLILIICIAILLPNKVEAMYQSRGDKRSKTNFNDYFMNIRNMESSGQVMGLSETLGSYGTASSASNNIDVHMIKNTEYGGMAMLAASAYGNVPAANSNGTTTGNNFGVFGTSNSYEEFVSAGYDLNVNYAHNYIYYGPKKYSNGIAGLEIDKLNYRSGDATYETKNWYGAENSYYYYYTNYNSSRIPNILTRGMQGIFGYKYDLHNTSKYSRAAIVNGEGI